MEAPIYLDHNATTPLSAEVAEAMRPYLESPRKGFGWQFGNASSRSRFYGKLVKEQVEYARDHCAELLGCPSDCIIFTSGGTESNNIAIMGYATKNRSGGNHIITSTIEHPAVTNVVAYLGRNGFEITYVGVDEHGRIKMDDFSAALRPSTILVTIMHANNEIGTVQPIAEITSLVRNYESNQRGKKIAVHSDGSQTIGKLPTNMDELGVDMFTVAGHKFYGPKGVGALFVRKGVELDHVLHGAGQEGGRRAGTENVLAIVGLGKACELARVHYKDRVRHMEETRDLLYEEIVAHVAKLQESIPKAQVSVNGKIDCLCLPNTLSIGFHGVLGNSILDLVEGRVSSSAGSACHSNQLTISPVLQAVGTPRHIAMGTIRLSTGCLSTLDDMRTAARCIVEAYGTLLRRERKND